MKIIQFLSLSIFCLGTTGCASIVHGTRQEVSVSTIPPDASITDGETTIRSPATINLKRDKDHILTITKPGYETETVRVTHVLSGAVAGNILAGGPIGWGVDAISGAQWRLEPETLSVTLRPVRDGEKVDESNRPTLATLESKLDELDRLKEKKSITEDEYKSMREIAIRSTELNTKLSS